MNERQSDDVPDPIPDDELCFRYLLGELTADKAAQFEQRLATSPELGETLLGQADLINGLSAVQHHRPAVAATVSQVSRWSIAVSIVAIAACLLVVVLGVRARSADQDALASQQLTTRGVPSVDVTEDLLIARAWADSRPLQNSDEYDFADLDGDDSILDSEPSDVDSTLSWMFIAVSTNPELSDIGEQGAANDG